MGGQLCRIEFVKISRVQNNLAQYFIRSKECHTFFYLFFKVGHSLVKTLLNP
jgi:hypothetical protein